MNKFLQRLPEVIENEIREYTITTSFRLRMLLNKFPLAQMDTFFHGFTPFRIENAQRQRYLSLIYAHKVGVLNEKRCKKQELDRIYRYGCVEKVLEKNNDLYTWGYVNKNIKELLKNDERSYILFTYASWPTSQFNEYWKIQSKTRQPSKPEYIRRITHFCNFTLACSQNTQNEQFIQFCEKLVYDVIVGSLIMRKNK